MPYLLKRNKQMLPETQIAELGSDNTSFAVEFDPFAGPEIARVGLTTAPQLEIWLACLLGGNAANRAYNESFSLRFTGSLDGRAMQQALQEVADRHEALRSVFSADGKYICVFTRVEVPFSYQDLSSLPLNRRELLTTKAVANDAEHVFDLVQGPLVKATLLKLTDDQYHLIITAHHIVCDGWSLGILLQDVSVLYSSYSQGVSAALPAPPSFSEYADEQLLFQASKEYKHTEAFWINQYKDTVPVVDMPTDFPRPPYRTYASARLDFSLSNELVARVKRTGLQAGCSFVTTLLASFEVLLHRLTGQQSIVVGIPTAGQPTSGSQHLIGHCVNLLPLRSEHTATDSFSTYLQQRKTYLFDAYEHQGLTFGSLLKSINISRDASRIPLVPVVFNVDMGLANGVSFHGLTYQLQSNPRAFETFDLFLNASGTEEEVVLEWSYNTALFKAESIKNMMTTFEQLLDEVTANPNSTLTPPRKNSATNLPRAYQVLNNTTVSYSSTGYLPDLIQDIAYKHPAAIAVKFNEATLSYYQLNAKANQLARYLLAKGLSAGDVVGIALNRSQELLVTLLAVLKCGATYLPLDPTYPADRLEFMLQDSKASFLLKSNTLGSGFHDSISVDIEDALYQAERYSTDALEVAISGDAVVYILYTSGSTGLPKGVQIKHSGLVNLLRSVQQEVGISTADKLLAITTISFDMAVLELFLPLVSGAMVVVADSKATKDGNALRHLIEAEAITVMQATPATWRMMLNAGWTEQYPLKAISGGEALPEDLAQRLLARCASLWNMYGPTETTIYSSFKQLTHANELITIGKPISNTQFYILDEQFNLVEPNTIGELYIAGDGLAKGYLNRPELNQDKFINNPFSLTDGEKMYRTGDLAKLVDTGEIQYLGRADQQIKIRGYRIEPGEIEHQLSSINEIQEAVVIAKLDSYGMTRLVAYVAVRNFNSATDFSTRIMSWKNSLANKLPVFMLPNDIIVISSIPKTLNGKTDRAALLSYVKVDETKAVERHDGPRTDIEKLVADIWKQYLQVPTVGIFDDFFKLGGHSLIAVQVIAQLEKATGKKLPLATLFESSTVEKLAAVLQMDSKFITWDSLVPIKPQGSKTPLYIVHGAGLNVLIFKALSKNLDPEQPIYALQAKGLNGIDEPHGTIEEMAAHYISTIERVNPNGPYALAGYSFGGIIAFEMAKQLKAAGKAVPFLAMFDTYADQPDHFTPFLTRYTKRFLFFLKRILFFFVLLRKSPKATIQYKVEAIRRDFQKLKYSKEQYYEEVYGHSYKMASMHKSAAHKYKLTPQNIKIELFRAKDRTYYVDDFEYMGWEPFALNEISIHEVPGDHNYMFAPPHDEETGRILQYALNKIK
ncbi:non-ribosomal peptide synthetase [Hymenobacter sp. YC55]|uniref:non-ribosomal peptide synthetase n=1 Tax=Hymenobacter sp. YC55 TaxID=3034019 RepID=UPI0023F96D87|nr:non-ribosomal peptide synthetase [Hymenobacter sp. YC55]MDF7810789.1 amino acid adenylation domain-containing protein [Hymenobacter sp. YC55]